ncbi:MAG TPA: cupredoxin family copper-binding protein [Gemmatimonadaceae bacterium]|nr:cupredoxin family copper-binding protein [Gemmatimonadaceae bacterium]
MAWLLAGAGLYAPAAGAQSLLDRPDNLSADWVGNTGTLYFNFIHRFSSSPPPERKVTNFPTFLVAAGIASRALVGVNYATNSALVPRYPNEYELFARYKLWQQDDGRPLDLGGSVDYNVSVRGVDGELSVARREGPLRLAAVGRVLADTLHGGPTRFAFGGGGTLRLFRYVALAGDAARMTIDGARVVWSAGVHLALPNTPHTLSIHASNANTATLQGLSRGGGVRRYGFEFTIPLTLSRFFHPMAAVPAPAASAAAAAPGTVNARIDGLAFVPSRIEIPVGTTVQWKNNDPLIHTVTAADSSFASPQFGLDGTYRHTFATPGTYAYYCALHPNMKGTVVVK